MKDFSKFESLDIKITLYKQKLLTLILTYITKGKTEGCILQRWKNDPSRKILQGLWNNENEKVNAPNQSLTIGKRDNTQCEASVTK
jgi:hypothetical protein